MLMVHPDLLPAVWEELHPFIQAGEVEYSFRSGYAIFWGVTPWAKMWMARAWGGSGKTN